MKILIVLLLCLQSVSHAGLLLIPSTEIKFEDYVRRCTNSEYLCTTDYFLSLLKNHRTDQFDNLIDSVDLNSTKFIHEFHNKIIHILNSEDLNRTQLALLINLLKQINTQQPTLLFKMVENELLRIQSVIETATRPGNNLFVFIFKEALSVKDAKKIRTTVLKIPLYVLHFSSVPYKTNTLDFNKVIRRPLLSGICGDSRLIYKIKSMKYCVVHNTAPDTDPSSIIKERYY